MFYEIVLELCTKKVQKEIYMNKFYTECVVKINVRCEIQANSIDEAKSLVEDEIRNQFQIGFRYETNEASIVSIDSSEAKIDETFTEFKIQEIDEFDFEYFERISENS